MSKPRYRPPRGSLTIACVLLAAVIWPGFRLASSEEPAVAADGEDGPIARISMPYNNSLVRANVPVFGVADAKDFKLYRLEFGEGPDPKEWHVITVSPPPRPSDPWAAGKVKWDPSRGTQGNLGDCHTGLTSYRYFDRYENLNGVYALRLVVEDKAGRSTEARAVVNVARAITKPGAGVAVMPAADRAGRTPVLLPPPCTARRRATQASLRFIRCSHGRSLVYLVVTGSREHGLLCRRPEG